MILITGATGKLGRVVTETLLKKLPATKIAAFVRDAQKAADLQAQGVAVRVGDYNDVSSLDAAMQGIDKVLLIAGGAASNLLQQHQNVVDAARQAGVACFAYAGRALHDRATLASKFMDIHLQTDDLIMASGMNYVLFRNSRYTDTALGYLGPEVANTGIRVPAGDGRMAYALRSEMGEAIANVLADGDCDNRIYTFTGTEAYSFADVAAAASELLGKPVAYYQVTPEEFQAQLLERGIPAHVASNITASMRDIKAGQEADVSPDLERKLGRKPATLQEGLKTLLPTSK